MNVHCSFVYLANSILVNFSLWRNRIQLRLGKNPWFRWAWTPVTEILDFLPRLVLMAPGHVALEKCCKSLLNRTACPRSLDPFYIGIYYMKWVKPSRTYSIWILSFYRDLSCYFEVQMSPFMTRKIVLSLLCSSLRQTMVLGYSSVR